LNHVRVALWLSLCWTTEKCKKNSTFLQESKVNPALTGVARLTTTAPPSHVRLTYRRRQTPAPRHISCICGGVSSGVVTRQTIRTMLKMVRSRDRHARRKPLSHRSVSKLIARTSTTKQATYGQQYPVQRRYDPGQWTCCNDDSAKATPYLVYLWDQPTLPADVTFQLHAFQNSAITQP
jgi:hypothetical protein